MNKALENEDARTFQSMTSWWSASNSAPDALPSLYIGACIRAQVRWRRPPRAPRSQVELLGHASTQAWGSTTQTRLLACENAVSYCS